MKKIVVTIQIIFSIIIILSSFLFLSMGIFIPGLMPLSLSVAMLCMLYTTWNNFILGKIKKSIWITSLILLIISILFSFIAGIEQILHATIC